MECGLDRMQSSSPDIRSASTCSEEIRAPEKANAGTSPSPFERFWVAKHPYCTLPLSRRAFTARHSQLLSGSTHVTRARQMGQSDDVAGK